jgi:hypothetical protein
MAWKPYSLSTGTQREEGDYCFEEKTGKILARSKTSGKDLVAGIFSQTPIGIWPDPKQRTLEVGHHLKVTPSEIMTQIKDPSSAEAWFVLPSQLNGAEYVSDQDIASHVEDYKYDNTGGPRGQLAGHPAAAQYILDHAANEDRPNGINAIDLIEPALNAAGFPFKLVNGYLKIPPIPEEERQSAACDVLDHHLSALRPLIMSSVPASGLTSDKKSLTAPGHAVTLVYASAVPVDSYLNRTRDEKQVKFQTRIAKRILVAQYYGALKAAAASIGTKEPVQIFLMPLGGGVFSNPWDIIMLAVTQAIDMLEDDELTRLDVHILTWNGAPAEERNTLLCLKQLTSFADRHQKWLESE